MSTKIRRIVFIVGFLLLALVIVVSLINTAFNGTSNSFLGRGSTSYDSVDFAKNEESYESPTMDGDMATDMNQKLIQTGRISIEVSDVDSSYNEIVPLLEASEAYLFNMQESSYNEYKEMNLTIKVKAENFEKLFATLKEQGKVLSSTVNTEDVTKQYVDTSARIDTLTIQETTLKNILAKATKVEDLIKIETELQRVREEIEASQGYLNYLDNAISFSVISLSITEERDPSTVIDADDSILDLLVFSIKDGFGFWGRFFITMIAGIFWLIPLVVVLGGLGLAGYQVVRKVVKKKS